MFGKVLRSMELFLFQMDFQNFWYETLFWEKLLLRMTASSLDSLHEPLERTYSNSRCVNKRLQGETESSQAKLTVRMVVHFLNPVTLPLRASQNSLESSFGKALKLHSPFKKEDQECRVRCLIMLCSGMMFTAVVKLKDGRFEGKMPFV